LQCCWSLREPGHITSPPNPLLLTGLDPVPVGLGPLLLVLIDLGRVDAHNHSRQHGVVEPSCTTHCLGDADPHRVLLQLDNHQLSYGALILEVNVGGSVCLGILPLPATGGSSSLRSCFSSPCRTTTSSPCSSTMWSTVLVSELNVCGSWFQVQWRGFCCSKVLRSTSLGAYESAASAPRPAQTHSSHARGTTWMLWMSTIWLRPSADSCRQRAQICLRCSCASPGAEEGLLWVRLEPPRAHNLVRDNASQIVARRHTAAGPIAAWHGPSASW
jgi:hypothetical protein